MIFIFQSTFLKCFASKCNFFFYFDFSVLIKDTMAGKYFTYLYVIIFTMDTNVMLFSQLQMILVSIPSKTNPLSRSSSRPTMTTGWSTARPPWPTALSSTLLPRIGQTTWCPLTPWCTAAPMTARTCSPCPAQPNLISKVSPAFLLIYSRYWFFVYFYFEVAWNFKQLTKT